MNKIVAWNKGIPVIKKCIVCGTEFSICKSAAPKRQCCSRKCKGINKRGTSAWNKGLKGAEYFSHYPNGLSGGVKKGYIPWNKGKTGIKTSDKGRIEYLNTNYKGGRFVDAGYISILHRTHPHRSKKNYIREHRVIVEKHLGRYLNIGEDVHHINGIKTDNRIANLMAFNSRSAHRRYEGGKSKVYTQEILFDGRTI